MKLPLIFPCLSLLLLLAPACTVAKERAPAARGTDADAEVGSAATGVKVPPEMDKLYPRIGKWQATIRTRPGPGSPQAVSTTAS
jgi:hypothetical protein